MNTLIIKINTITLILMLLLASCSRNEETKACCAKENAEECEKLEDQTPVTITDESIYQLTSEWENQDKEKTLLSDNAGKTVVAAMIFTHCPSACPRIVADVKRIEAALSEKEKENTKFLLISMDPEGDTPERMAEFAKDHQLGENWEIIRSDATSTMELANVLGVRIKPLSDGGFDHSNTIHIINRNGEIDFQQHGLNIDPGKSIAHLRTLLSGKKNTENLQLTETKM